MTTWDINGVAYSDEAAVRALAAQRHQQAMQIVADLDRSTTPPTGRKPTPAPDTTGVTEGGDTEGSDA